MKKIKKISLVLLATICAFASTTAITASALTHSISVLTKTSKKVTIKLTADSYTTLVINPLQCRGKNSKNQYINFTDTNSAGGSKGISATVTPGSGWTLVSSSTYDFMKYKVGSSGDSYYYYWKS